MLRRNGNFLRPLDDGGAEHALALAARWEELCGSAEEEPLPGGCTDAAALRIFERDAERTFMTTEHRASMIGALKRFWPENRDYHQVRARACGTAGGAARATRADCRAPLPPHTLSGPQGLGYVYSFVRLTLPPDAALRLVLRLNRSERHLAGYWYAAPQAYVRDAMVYSKLAAEHFPEVAALLSQAGVAAEAYVSKWFVGLCLHVLPFRALFAFYSKLLEQGAPFLFKFALSLLRHTSGALLACAPTDASSIFAILRLDPALYPDDHPVHEEIVEGAALWELADERIAELREQEQAALDAKMVKVREAERKLAEEGGSDDEIVFSDEEEDEDPEERLRRLAADN